MVHLERVGRTASKPARIITSRVAVRRRIDRAPNGLGHAHPAFTTHVVWKIRSLTVTIRFGQPLTAHSGYRQVHRHRWRHAEGCRQYIRIPQPLTSEQTSAQLSRAERGELHVADLLMAMAPCAMSTHDLRDLRWTLRATVNEVVETGAAAFVTDGGEQVAVLISVAEYAKFTHPAGGSR